MNNNIISLIVTHNSRLRCLLRNILSNESNKKIQRFKNCVILRLEITKQNNNYNIKLEMVYEGTVNEKELQKKTYYVSKGEGEIGYINFINNYQKGGNYKSKKTKKKHIVVKPISQTIDENNFKKLFEISSISQFNFIENL